MKVMTLGNMAAGFIGSATNSACDEPSFLFFFLHLDK